MDADAGAIGLLQRQAADRRLCLGLDLRLALGVAAPPALDEAHARLVGEDRLELLVVAHAIGARALEGERLIVERLLDLVQQLRNALSHRSLAMVSFAPRFVRGTATT